MEIFIKEILSVSENPNGFTCQKEEEVKEKLTKAYLLFAKKFSLTLDANVTGVRFGLGFLIDDSEPEAYLISSNSGKLIEIWVNPKKNVQVTFPSEFDDIRRKLVAMLRSKRVKVTFVPERESN